jgi:hypothetical protein
MCLKSRKTFAIGALLLGLVVPVSTAASAEGIAPLKLGPVEVYGQATYIYQRKSAFSAAYTGENSLTPLAARSYSLTGTLFLGAKLTDTLEAYFNPEVAQGEPFSGLHGLGGFPNGEIARTSGPTLKLYSARAFLRKTWNMGGEPEPQESEPNRVATVYSADRIVLTAGQVSVLDLFDTVAYSRDARTQFMNWASLTYGAWDFPADARGYTWGVALEYVTPAYAVRAGRFMVPKESNGLQLDANFFQYYGDVAEAEVPFKLWDRPGVARALVFHNYANMGSYNDAIALGAATGTTPALSDVRVPQSKWGFGVGVQQELAQDVGAYLRAAWNDGQTETYMFTEIDRSIAAGVLASGGRWSRPKDSTGVAFYVNGISGPHRQYLGLGGLGFFLGDGQLNYGTERIVEAFYGLHLFWGAWLGLGWQHVANPGYNRDRGPVDFLSLRLHAEF